jgi:uncharacterized protein (DUF1015 family)
MSRACEEDPPFDYLLALLLDAASEPLTVLPTHRVVRAQGLDSDWLRGAATLFDVTAPVSRDDLVREFAGTAAGGRGRFGVWTRAGGAMLTARQQAFTAFLPAGGTAVRSLDVTLLGVAIERLLGIDAESVAREERVRYTKSAADAIALVESGDGDIAFLLEPTPISAIEQVAAEGDVMPQKSTYFYPKPLTGLVINPHEW